MKRVSGLKFWLLGIVTCGIYPLIVWGRMGQNANTIADRVGDRSIGSFWVAFLLGMITFGIFSFIWVIRYVCLVSRLNKKLNAGISPDHPFLIFLISYIPIFSLFWLADANNKLIDAYKK